MTISLQYVNITVTDVEASIPFYQALGLEIVMDVP